MMLDRSLSARSRCTCLVSSYHPVSRTILLSLSVAQHSHCEGNVLFHGQFGLLNNAKNVLKSLSVWGSCAAVLAKEASNLAKNLVLSGALSENSSGCRLVTIPLWVW